VFGEKLVDVHDEHTRFPVSFLNFPAAQSTHEFTLPGIPRPAGHMQLLISLFATGAIECAGQFLQLFTVSPAAFEY